jgi:regulator of RNase E activity RraA
MAPAATFFMVSKATASFPNPTPPEDDAWRQSSVGSNASPYADFTHEDSVAVISQPPGQACAVVGGIMGARMKHRGVQGIVVDGRIRDLVSLAETGLPVWSKGTSVVGAGAETKFQAWNCPLRIGETIVEPGDLVMMDPLENGVVVIPQDKVDDVLELLPKLVAADEKVLRDVEAGVSVAEAFMRHRNA